MNSEQALAKHSKKASKLLIKSASIEKKKLNSDVVKISHMKVRPHKSIIDQKGEIY